jgi:hypothetical protein
MSRLVLIGAALVAVLAVTGSVVALLPGEDLPAAKRTAKATHTPKTTQALRHPSVHLGKSGGAKRGAERNAWSSAAARSNADHLPYEPGELLVGGRRPGSPPAPHHWG